MRVAVWDTYVEKKDGDTMHFDILAPHEVTDENQIHEMGRKYLAAKGQEGQSLTARECRLCHIEIAPAEIRESIERHGFHIIEMEGCD